MECGTRVECKRDNSTSALNHLLYFTQSVFVLEEVKSPPGDIEQTLLVFTD